MKWLCVYEVVYRSYLCRYPDVERDDIIQETEHALTVHFGVDRSQ